jgi:hypothetical protein
VKQVESNARVSKEEHRRIFQLAAYKKQPKGPADAADHMAQRSSRERLIDKVSARRRNTVSITKRACLPRSGQKRLRSRAKWNVENCAQDERHKMNVLKRGVEHRCTEKFPAVAER